MGNEVNKNTNEKSFYMNIKMIGKDIEGFYKRIKESISLKNILKLWNFEPIQKEATNTNQLNEYFDKLKKIKEDEDKTQDIKELLILKINNLLDPEVKIIIERMDELSEKQYMPLILLLTIEDTQKKLDIDTEIYEQIDPRLIFIEKYTEDAKQIEEIISPRFLRFFSILNELGDRFTIGEGDKLDSYDLINNYFPFNLNIACIGRFGQGKSTGVNEILQEYKAPESSKGSSQTKNLTFYQVENQPVRILDIPGFENEQTVNDAIEKFKYCREKIDDMKENLHIILYFLNFNEKRAFTKLEYPMVEEIIKHESAKIIYVITHSSPNIQKKIKQKIYDRINSGIQGITKDTQIQNKIEKFNASENNVVFVNFLKNDLNGDKPFGQKELYNKIHDFFIESNDYKNSLKELNEEQLELQISKLRKQAEDIIHWHKVGIYILSAIPFLFEIENILIKKDAIKKIEKVFGLEPNLSEEIKKNNNVGAIDQNSFEEISKKKNNIISNVVASIPQIVISEFGLFNIGKINYILNLSVQNYRTNRNNLKNTYIKASLYFQR